MTTAIHTEIEEIGRLSAMTGQSTHTTDSPESGHSFSLNLHRLVT
jgi:hypothetical protein